jgi:hypothetical protein
MAERLHFRCEIPVLFIFYTYEYILALFFDFHKNNVKRRFCFWYGDLPDEP